MLELVLGLALILALYARTFKYNRCIDDIVPMSGYLYDVPTTAPAPSFFLQRTPSWHRVLAIGCHLFNTWLVYLLLGGKAALLFAVFPVSVNNVAWITGSYYSCTTLLTLISFYFITYVTWWIGLPVAACVYAVALNTTVATIFFPFVFLFGNPLGLTMLIPLAGFLKGKRFTTGVKLRQVNFSCTKIDADVFTVGRIAVMVKLVALYLYTALVPMKLLFFRSFGARYRIDPVLRKQMDSFDALFWMSVALIATFITVGYVIGMGFWAVWFVVMISAFSQYKMLGQFFAERYMYPASIGVCAVLSVLPDPAFWALVGLYVMRSHMFIPVFKNNKEIYLNGTRQDDEPSNYCNLSDWYLVVERELTMAGYYIQRNIAIDPKDYKPYVNFCSLWLMLGNYKLALDNARHAKEMATGYASQFLHDIIDKLIQQAQDGVDGKLNPPVPTEAVNVKAS
jgi:hypothetical protein